MQKTQGSDEQGLSAPVPLPKLEWAQPGQALRLYSMGRVCGKSTIGAMLLNEAYERAAERLRRLSYFDLEVRALGKIKNLPDGSEALFSHYLRGELAGAIQSLSGSILEQMLYGGPLTVQEVEAKNLGTNITERLHASFMKRVQTIAPPSVPSSITQPDNGPRPDRPSQLHPVAIAVRIAVAKNAGVKHAGAKGQPVVPNTNPTEIYHA